MTHSWDTPSTQRARLSLAQAEHNLRQARKSYIAALEWERARLGRGLDVEGVDRALGISAEDEMAVAA